MVELLNSNVVWVSDVSFVHFYLSGRNFVGLLMVKKERNLCLLLIVPIYSWEFTFMKFKIYSIPKGYKHQDLIC
uniref:Uncharacterized protein n=1 Tax=Nelumbo nucifera TaxID=4432 RepID=A0A822Z8B7_NELNU|nr:TPA_asm: hypothetical protein HUJ06_000844 [Nelumbo nucifera]